MAYTIKAMAALSGLSQRTLRHYDQIGLLVPQRQAENGYRLYGPKEVDRLQDILFYRELGFSLPEIAKALYHPAFAREEALTAHLAALQKEKERLNRLIATITKTIEAERGTIAMSDKEKFQGFLKEQIDQNEAQYGAEIREKYGDETIDESNRKLMNLTEEAYQRMQAMGREIQQLLEEAVQGGLPADGPQGQKVAALHKEWLGFTWPKYTREAHLGLTDMYLSDERFTAHFDGKVPGCAQFLRDAVHAHV